MESHRRRLTPKELDVIRTMWPQEVSLQDIAAAVDTNPITVKRAARRLGLPERQWWQRPPTVRRTWTDDDLRTIARMLDDDASLEEIARHFGVSSDTIRRQVKRAGMAPRPQKGGPSGLGAEGDALLRELWLAGEPVAEIGARLGGLHEVTVRHHARRLGLPTDIPRRRQSRPSPADRTHTRRGP